MGQGGGLQLLRPGGGQETVCQVPPAGGNPLPEDGGGGEALRGRGASWPAPWRGTASTWGDQPRAEAARRYSTPRLSLGRERTFARSDPSRAATTAWRQAAKGIPSSRKRLRPARYASLSRQAAAAARAAGSPLSLPKERTSTTPQARSRATAPVAKDSAEEAAHTVGSSSTRSAPPARAQPPGPLVRCGAGAPLDPVAAHDSDDGAVRTQEPPGAGDLIGVASVEGIVFGYDTGSFQTERPLSDRMSVWRCLKKCMMKSKKMVVLQGKKQ